MPMRISGKKKKGSKLTPNEVSRERRSQEKTSFKIDTLFFEARSVR